VLHPAGVLMLSFRKDIFRIRKSQDVYSQRKQTTILATTHQIPPHSIAHSASQERGSGGISSRPFPSFPYSATKTPPRLVYLCVTRSAPRRREPRHRGDRGGSSTRIHAPSYCGAKGNPSRCVCAISSFEASDAVAEGVLVSGCGGFWFNETVFWIWRRWSF
jgi:hypothetical protein